MKTRIMFVICLALCLCPIVSHSEVWDVAEDFSATQNPTGQWSYGWRTTADEPLILYTDNTTPHWMCDPEEYDTDFWRYDIAYSCPLVEHNPHDYTLYCGGWALAPNAVNFHPGPAQQSVVRWTSPGELLVALTARFESIDFGSKIVRVYCNGSELFSAPLEGIGQTAEYSTILSVQPGDFIECAIDPISFYYDSTQLDMVLETLGPVPVVAETWGQVKAIFR